MSSARLPGDQARVSVLVRVPPAAAFRVFTEAIDEWWRRGFKYRALAQVGSELCLEPKLGGRLFERFHDGVTQQVVETGRVTAWEPSKRLVFEWRARNFAPGEITEVEVTFAPSASGTLVTVTHRGFSRLRPDHPVRHGLDVPGFIRMMALLWGDLVSSLRQYAEDD